MFCLQESQIKVVREFEQMILYINETDLSFNNNVDLINSIIKAATDENVLIHLGLCFEQAFPKVVEKSTAYAKKKKIELDPDTPILDIFSIEELVGSVVPFIYSPRQEVERGASETELKPRSPTEELEEVVGILLASGHTLDNILDMSWDQIKITSRSILRHKVSMLNMILEPIANSLGTKYNKSKVKKPKTKFKYDERTKRPRKT